MSSKEGKLAKCWWLLSLGDGYTGLHCVLLSALFIFEIFHSRKFLFSPIWSQSWRGTHPWSGIRVQMCLGHAPRLEPDLRLTHLVPALTLNLLCDVDQVTHHLWASVLQERRRSLNVMGSNHLPFSISDTGHIYLACSGSTGGQWVSTPFLKTAFAERVLWPNKLERHLITTSSLSWQITSPISTLKALTSPVAEMPVQHFPNLFDCRTLKSWPFLYPRHQSY